MAAGTQLDEMSRQYLSHPVYVAQERAVLSAERDAYPNLGQVKKDYDELQGLLRSASPGFAALHADKLQDLKSKYFNPSATAFKADVLSRLSSALQEPLTNYTRHFFPGGRINGKVQEVLAQLNAVNTSIPNIDSLGFSAVLGAEAEPLTEITSHAKIYISSLANFAPVMQSVVHGDRKGQSVNMSSQVAVQAVKAWLTLGAPLKSPWKDNAAMSRLYSHLQTFCQKHVSGSIINSVKPYLEFAKSLTAYFVQAGSAEAVSTLVSKAFHKEMCGDVAELPDSGGPIRRLFEHHGAFVGESMSLHESTGSRFGNAGFFVFVLVEAFVHVAQHHVSVNARVPALLKSITQVVKDAANVDQQVTAMNQKLPIPDILQDAALQVAEAIKVSEHVQEVRRLEFKFTCMCVVVVVKRGGGVLLRKQDCCQVVETWLCANILIAVFTFILLIRWPKRSLSAKV